MRDILVSTCVVLALVVAVPSAQTPAQTDLANQMQLLLDKWRAANPTPVPAPTPTPVPTPVPTPIPTPTPTPTPIPIPTPTPLPLPSTPVIMTPAALDAAKTVAPAGAVLVVSNTLVYPTAFQITKPVTLRAETVPAGRMTLTPVLPVFRGGITVNANDVTLIGLEVRNATYPNSTIVEFTGARVTLDRVRIRGDAVTGARRGIGAFPRGGSAIVRSYIGDCFRPSPGDDTQAIAMWEGTGLLIEDNFLEAGSETILIGGADAKTADLMPADFTIRGNTITAKLAWMGRAIGVKTRLELKVGRRFLIENNIIENVWQQGQGGYLLSLTVRNQEGTAAWSTIEDGIIRNNTFQHGSAAMNILARDDAFPSGTSARVQILGNTFSDLDPVKYMNGNSKMIQLSGGPKDYTIDGNTFTGAHLSSSLYFAGGGKLENFKVTNNKWPTTDYGVFADGGSVGLNPTTGLPKMWELWTLNGTFTGNVVTP